MIQIWLAIFLLSILPTWAHQGHHHGDPQVRKSPEPKESPKAKIYELINQDYKAQVEPIFKRSCFDCHSQNPKLPWYGSLPGARQLMENDMSESKEHLDMSSGFPFQGHGSADEDLEAIQQVLEKGSMPPLRYKILHWDSGLTAPEKTAVFKWVQDSQERLREIQAHSSNIGDETRSSQ